MRTTLDLDDDLMRALKIRAAETGHTMTKIIEEALRQALQQPTREPFSLRLPTVSGRLLPGVDLTDRDALYDRMEGRR